MRCELSAGGREGGSEKEVKQKEENLAATSSLSRYWQRARTFYPTSRIQQVPW